MEKSLGMGLALLVTLLQGSAAAGEGEEGQGLRVHGSIRGWGVFVVGRRVRGGGSAQRTELGFCTARRQLEAFGVGPVKAMTS